MTDNSNQQMNCCFLNEYLENKVFNLLDHLYSWQLRQENESDFIKGFRFAFLKLGSPWQTIKWVSIFYYVSATLSLWRDPQNWMILLTTLNWWNAARRLAMKSPKWCIVGTMLILSFSVSMMRRFRLEQGSNSLSVSRMMR